LNSASAVGSDADHAAANHGTADPSAAFAAVTRFLSDPQGGNWIARCETRVLFSVVRSVIGAHLVLTALLWIPGVAQRPALATLILLASASPMFGALALAHRGRLAAAGRFTVTAMILGAMISVASFGGLRGPIVYSLPLSIVAAGLLRGRSAAILAAAASGAFVAVEAVLELAGLAPFVTSSFTPMASLFCVTSAIAIAFGLIAVYTREVQLARRDAAESTRRAMAVEHEVANLVRFAPDGIAVLSSDGVIELANDAMARIVGRPVASLVGLGIADLHGVFTGAAREVALEGLARLHERGEALWELTVTATTGIRVPVEVNARLVTQFDGKRRVQLVVRDMTFRAEAELARDRLEAELREARRLQGLGRLAGSIAHDFRNLLTPIFVNAGILKDCGVLRPEEREVVKDIDFAAQRANALTLQLLAFARRQDLELRAVDLNQVVRDVEPILRGLIRGDISLRFDLGPALGALSGDRTQLEQVLVNLVANARDAIAAGGMIRIETSNMTVTPEEAARRPGRRAGDYVVLAVSDSGSGIPEEVRRHIFEPFFTTKGSDQGTGLGLATVHGIVSQCGGSIDVESAVGRGTVFRVFLPRADAIPDRPSESIPAPVAALRPGRMYDAVARADGLRPPP
jgi:PAS domain S-box-containing protein